MMPECGEIDIFYEPKATDGFHLGLMEDFGLPSEAEDPVLDDMIHVDTTATGGILAGSNPRSVLFAVYRFLWENGCRWLHPGVDGDYVPIYTNVCMSNPQIRAAIVREIADYAQTHHNIDYLHVWLSDGSKNHCECDECQKMRPSDWYMVMMNELDEELTKRALDSRIVFISYVDTMFGPEQVTIRNPQRFSLLYAPISRSYTASITEDSVIPEPLPYVRNAWKTPASAEESFAQLKHWRNTWKGPAFSYEYHFWRHQFLDPGGITFARRVYEDVRSLKVMELDGYVEDGSQRSGFPNAFPVYIYAETLMNRECDFDAVLEDYFSHIYGKDWQTAYMLLKGISDAFDFAYMEGERSKDKRISDFYDPDRVEQLSRIRELAARERAAANKHLNMPTRPQTVSWRLLLRHADFCQQLAQILLAKAVGHNYKAVELAKDFFCSFGKYEIEMERYYDHCLACRSVEHIIRRPQGIILD